MRRHGRAGLKFLYLLLGVLPSARAASSSAASKKTEIWQIDLLPGAAPHPAPPPPPPPAPYPSQKAGLGGLGHHDLSGDVFELPMVHAVQQPFPMFQGGGGGGGGVGVVGGVGGVGGAGIGPGWQSAPDCPFEKTEMSVLMPILTFVVGFALLVPIVGLLFLLKMQLWTQLTGSSGTQTVTTSVGGKEDVLARKVADVWPVFRDAIGKYVKQDSGKTPSN